MKFFRTLPPWATWGLTLPLIVLNGWLLLQIFYFFQPLTTVFSIAILLAFVLDYLVQFLQRNGMERTQAVLLVFFLTIALLIFLGVTLVPIAIDQLDELLNRLPTWIESGSQQIQSLDRWAAVRRLPIDLSSFSNQIASRLTNEIQSISGNVLTFIVGALSRAFEVLLAIVLTFYLLLHGERLWDGLFQWLPVSQRIQFRRSLHKNFHNYFSGQSILASLMAFAMILAFSIMRVPFGLLFGLGVGIMTLFPFGVGLSICLISFLLALQSFWLGVKVWVVATIIDQVIENGIAPRLLGGLTGLNPVWVLVSLLVGAKLLGLLGVVVAVPLAGFIRSILEARKYPLNGSAIADSTSN
jgi:predicted PurR-regulated permease PerM